MYIVDVIGGRVSLLRSVCVAKAAVRVAGECLVRPELTIEYLTITMIASRGFVRLKFSETGPSMRRSNSTRPHPGRRPNSQRVRSAHGVEQAANERS